MSLQCSHFSQHRILEGNSRSPLRGKKSQKCDPFPHKILRVLKNSKFTDLTIAIFLSEIKDGESELSRLGVGRKHFPLLLHLQVSAF